MDEKIFNGSKVCVTGGSGYIASCLIKKLLEKGYTVHATLRNLGIYYLIDLSSSPKYTWKRKRLMI